MNHYVILTLGVVCAGIGGDLFLRGAVGIAHWARVSPGVIGATVVAFATSSPELAVSISGACYYCFTSPTSSLFFSRRIAALMSSLLGT